MGVKIYQIIIVVLAFGCYHFWNKSKEFEVTSEGEKSAYNVLANELRSDIESYKSLSEKYEHEADSINQLFIQSQLGHETNYNNFQNGLSTIHSGTITERIGRVASDLDKTDSIGWR